MEGRDLRVWTELGKNKQDVQYEKPYKAEEQEMVEDKKGMRRENVYGVYLIYYIQKRGK